MKIIDIRYIKGAPIKMRAFQEAWEVKNSHYLSSLYHSLWRENKIDLCLPEDIVQDIQARFNGQNQDTG